MLQLNEKHFISKNYQIYEKEQLQVPGLELLGHSSHNVVQEPLKKHMHPNCFEICFVAKGSQLYTVDKLEYNVLGNTSFITKPDEIHGTGNNPHGKIKLYWLQLNVGDKDFLYLNEKTAKNLISSLMAISDRVKKHKPDMQSLFKQMFFCLISEDEREKLSGVSLLLYFLNSILISNNNNQENISVQTNLALKYIDNHIYEKIYLADVAIYAGISNSYFKKIFKAETGRSPGDYINSRKIKKAKEMLNNFGSITDAAFTLGFSSSAYFSTVFKNYVGLTPSEFILLNEKEKS